MRTSDCPTVRPLVRPINSPSARLVRNEDDDPFTLDNHRTAQERSCTGAHSCAIEILFGLRLTQWDADHLRAHARLGERVVAPRDQKRDVKKQIHLKQRYTDGDNQSSKEALESSHPRRSSSNGREEIWMMNTNTLHEVWIEINKKNVQRTSQKGKEGST